MLKSATEIQSFRQRFRDIHTELSSIAATLTLSGNPVVSTAIQDIAHLVRSVEKLEQDVCQNLDQQKGQLAALMEISSAINSSHGKKYVLEEVMDLLIAITHAERGFLMLRDQNGELRSEVARGIAHINLASRSFQVSSTVVRRVAESGESVLTTNAQEDPRFENQASVAAYQLRSIMCAPLKIKNKLIGVIYVDNRVRSGLFQAGDLEVIKAFADQAAVAIDNATLFDDLQASNQDLEYANRKLELAYQKTLEGWVHALDLRDKETEGHTQRVRILTTRLARSMGMDEETLIHIERGALLHDIGKMGIPDAILSKVSELSDQERTLMQQHPIYAHELLKEIEFLEPALDIPYCHHEKWDGSGYPRGLKELDIPFAARIFAVVDVWDALVSDRPYHKGRSPADVRRMIEQDAGKHFDPQVVRAFFELDDLSV